MSMEPKSALSSRDAFAVSPSDTENLTYKGIPVTAKGIYIGTTGNLKVKRAGGGVVTYANLPVGMWPIQCVRVYDTGTTAEDIIAEVE